MMHLTVRTVLVLTTALSAALAGAFVSAAAAQSTAPPLSVTVPLGPGRDGTQQGTATLTADGPRTIVAIDITPGEPGVPQPAHIHEGSCPDVGPVAHPLQDVVDGASTTTVEASLAELLSGGFAINIHRSQTAIAEYTACGNIPRGVVAVLGPGRDGSQPGSAALISRDGQTEVVVAIVPGEPGVAQPAHVHDGACPEVGPVAFALTDIVDGRSTTLIDTPLEQVVSGNRAINVHRSQQEIQAYVACGAISTAQETPTGAATPGAPPSGNAGLRGESGDAGTALLLAALLALALAGGALWLVRRAS